MDKDVLCCFYFETITFRVKYKDHYKWAIFFILSKVRSLHNIRSCIVISFLRYIRKFEKKYFKIYTDLFYVEHEILEKTISRIIFIYCLFSTVNKFDEHWQNNNIVDPQLKYGLRLRTAYWVGIIITFNRWLNVYANNIILTLRCALGNWWKYIIMR